LSMEFKRFVHTIILMRCQIVWTNRLNSIDNNCRFCSRCAAL